MSEVDRFLKGYEEFLCLPWERNLAGPQKVWILIYEPAQERRMRFRMLDFEAATKKAGHAWVLLDLTDAFAHWMSEHEYREEYFQQPDDLTLALRDFADDLAVQVKAQLTANNVDDNTVVAISGLGSLFGLTRVSALLEDVAPSIKGRLLVFFPGHQEGFNRRLLDARDGWDYHAVSITAAEGE